MVGDTGFEPVLSMLCSCACQGIMSHSSRKILDFVRVAVASCCIVLVEARGNSYASCLLVFREGAMDRENEK